jgi:hypothetical protein
MKTKHFLIGITAALLLCGGCEKEKDLPYLNILEIGDHWISYSPPEILANGGTYTISIGSNVAWTAKIDAAATWCGILSSNTSTGVIVENPYNHSVPLQQGLVTISATMIPYTATEGRTTMLTLTSADISTTYTINQIPGIRMGDIIIARTNVDEFGTFAEDPASFGKFYQFNRTIAYHPTEPVGSIPPNWPATYISENSNWLTENDPCPPGWKMPDAISFTNSDFVYQFVNGFAHLHIRGIESFKFVNIADGGFPMSGFLCGNSIETATWDDMQDCFFLPAISYRDNTGLYNAYDFYNKGYYWTQYGLAFSGTLGTFIRFDRNDRDGDLFIDYMNKGSALPIRCIKR